MREHSIFEDVPYGRRLYVTAASGDKDAGIWLWLPVYWMACAWRDIRIGYLRWKLERRHV